MRHVRKGQLVRLLMRLGVLMVVLSLIACTHRRRRGGGDDDDDATEVGDDDDDTGFGDDDDDTGFGDDDDDATPSGILGSNCLTYPYILTPGSLFTGSWGVGSPTWEISGGWYADYEFLLDVPTTLQIDLVSEGVDTILYLLAPDCSLVMVDDDGGEGLNSRLQLTDLEPGLWTLVAAPLGGADEGTFTLLMNTGFSDTPM